MKFVPKPPINNDVLVYRRIYASFGLNELKVSIKILFAKNKWFKLAIPADKKHKIVYFLDCI